MRMSILGTGQNVSLSSVLRSDQLHSVRILNLTGIEHILKVIDPMKGRKVYSFVVRLVIKVLGKGREQRVRI